ncbi:MAG: outer membrane beta-barrel protein, partial [Vicinamibacterales bacterium]
MFRPRGWCAIAALTLSVAGAGTASAQSVAEPKTWTVTGFLGGSAGTDAPSIGGNSLAIGAAVGYDLTSNVGFEGELGYLFDLAGDNDQVDWSVTNYTGNLLYHFDVKRVTPYATFGIGIEHGGIGGAAASTLDVASSSEVAFNFGGGVKYPITPRLLLRGDLRRFEANDFAPDYWRLYAGLT